MDKEKLLAELNKLLLECETKQSKFVDLSTSWYKAGGQISVINNLLHKVEAGKFD
jgi:hypothetical protein